MGGLSAAHELAERGFAVTVYEKRARAGRQGALATRRPTACRPSTASGSSRPSTGTCRTRWRGSRRALGPRATGWSAPSGSCSPAPTARTSCSRPRTRPSRSPTSRVLARFVFDAATQLGVPAVDVAWLLERLFTLLACCDERRVEQWDRAELVGLRAGRQALGGVPPLPRRRADADARRRAGERDERAHRRADPRAAAARPLARGRARRPRARRADLRGLDLAVGGAPASRAASRCGSASPSRASSCATAGSRRATVAGRRRPPTTTSPRCRSRSCAGCSRPSCARAEPRLNGLDRLVTRWMNGILFYLRDDLPLVRGHAIYLDSEWALTSISQRQFWRDVDARRVGGVLSIDISEWQRAGPPHRARSRRCARRRRSATRSGAQLRRPPRRALDGVEVDVLVPRRGDRVPEPVGRDQRRAAAGQHEGLVGRPAGRGDARSRT